MEYHQYHFLKFTFFGCLLFNKKRVLKAVKKKLDFEKI
jgi:hypothetical protein